MTLTWVVVKSHPLQTPDAIPQKAVRCFRQTPPAASRKPATKRITAVTKLDLSNACYCGMCGTRKPMPLVLAANIYAMQKKHRLPR